MSPFGSRASESFTSLAREIRLATWHPRPQYPAKIYTACLDTQYRPNNLSLSLSLSLSEHGGAARRPHLAHRLLSPLVLPGAMRALLTTPLLPRGAGPPLVASATLDTPFATPFFGVLRGTVFIWWYVHIYMCLYIHTYTYICVCVYIYIYIIYIYIYIYIYTCSSSFHFRAYKYTYIYICIPMYICIYICTYMYACICACI